MIEREYLPDCPDDVDDVIELSQSLSKWAKSQLKNHSIVLISEILILSGTEYLFRNLDEEEAKDLILKFVNLGLKFSEEPK